LKSKTCRKRLARYVKGLSAGAKSGKKFGMKSNSVQKNVGGTKAIPSIAAAAEYFF